MTDVTTSDYKCTHIPPPRPARGGRAWDGSPLPAPRVLAERGMEAPPPPPRGHPARTSTTPPAGGGAENGEGARKGEAGRGRGGFARGPSVAWRGGKGASRGGRAWDGGAGRGDVQTPTAKPNVGFLAMGVAEKVKRHINYNRGRG